MELFDLKNKKAIVTGAAGGLAHGIAEGLMEAGAELVIIDISPKVAETAADFCSRGFRAHAIQANLGNREELVQAVESALELLGGRLDILVPAAGIQRRSEAVNFSQKDWDDVLNINLSSVFLLNQLAGKIMVAQGSGKIINIASMLSYFGGVTVPAYAASKGGVAQLTKALANEWASKGVNVNALAPGYMATDMNTGLLQDDKRNAEITARIPAKRWGLPRDMKGPAVFLASSASDYLNGAIIPVDGGYMVR